MKLLISTSVVKPRMLEKAEYKSAQQATDAKFKPKIKEISLKLRSAKKEIAKERNPLQAAVDEASKALAKAQDALKSFDSNSTAGKLEQRLASITSAYEAQTYKLRRKYNMPTLQNRFAWLKEK